MRPHAGRLPIAACAVVIPAHDEAELLPRCLRGVTAAVDRLNAVQPDLMTTVVLVLDRCSDDSDSVAETFPIVHAMETDAGSVGMARHLGCRQAIAQMMHGAGTCWLACTDADSVVPPDWLTTHLRLAGEGADVVLGTVIPDYDEPTGTPFDRWLEQYPQTESDSFVHGANLGIRADLYLRIGGFRAAVQHEDVQLVEAARRSGAVLTSTSECAVLTSGRYTSRSAGGFSGRMTDRHGLGGFTRGF